jgi:hypothetical protein
MPGRMGLTALARKPANDWEFDRKTITVHIPITFERRGGRKLIVVPEGCQPWVSTKPRSGETLIH